MTPGHVSDELHQLLVGELASDEMVVVTDHLRACEPCRAELVDVSLAHALLSSVRELLAPELSCSGWGGGGERRTAELPRLRFLEDLPGRPAGPGGHDLPAPADGRPRHSFEAPRRDAASGARRKASEERVLPIVVALDAQPASTAAPAVRPHRRRPALSRDRRARHAGRAMYRSAIVAVAAAILVFAAIVGVGTLRHPSPRSSPILLTAVLEPMPAAPGAKGTVTVRADGDVTVATSGLGAPPSGYYYEVSLVAPGASNRLPLGILPAGGRGEFSFPAGLWNSYAGVAIILQSSGVSASSKGVAILSTFAPAHHRAAGHSRRPAPRTRRVPPARPPAHRHANSHGGTGHHVRKLPSGSGPVSPPVRRLLKASERVLVTGRVLTVDTTKDAPAVQPVSGVCRDRDGTCSLRAALEVADALGVAVTIHVPSGRYVLSHGALVASDPAGVSIDGAGASSTVITAQGQSDRVLLVDAKGAALPAGEGAVASLAQLTVESGTAPLTGVDAGDGGAILVADKADVLELSHVVVADSQASVAGGGLYARGQVWATAASFANDRAGISGGGAQFSHAMVLVTGSAFVDDLAGSNGAPAASGGALQDDASALVLVYSSLVGDSVVARGDPRGGAIDVRSPAWLATDRFAGDSVAVSTSSLGQAGARGGALYVGAGPVSVEAGAFTHDHTDGSRSFGGAVFNAGKLDLDAARFFADTAAATPPDGGGDGGAIYNAAELTLTQSTLRQDVATGDGARSLRRDRSRSPTRSSRTTGPEATEAGSTRAPRSP